MTARRIAPWVATGLVAGVASLAAASPAWAASGSSVSVTDRGTHQSVSGQTVTDDTTLRVSGTGQQPGRRYTLQVVEPDGSEYGQSSARAGFAPARPQLQVGTAEQPNGTWTATLTGGGTASFTLAIPPAQVSGLTAKAADGEVALHWSANPEPDLVGYAVRYPDGQTQTYPPGQTDCATASTCSLAYRPAGNEHGKQLHFTVTAERNGSCGCASDPLSAAPARITVWMPEAPSRTRHDRPGSGASSFRGSSGSGRSSDDSVNAGGYTAAGRLQAFVPRTGAKLPASIAAGRSGAAARRVLPGGEGAGAAGQQGGYRPTLGYPGGRERGPAAAHAPEASGSLTSAFDLDTLARSLGAAAVLLLAAGHLLVWLRRTPVEL